MKKLLGIFLLGIISAFGQNASGELSFTAKIANRNSDSIVIRSRTSNRVIKLNDKNEFKDKFEVTEGLHQLFDGTESTMLYLKNGYDLLLTMDAKQFDESIVYTGIGSKENNFIAQKALEDEAFETEFESMLNKDEAEFKAILEHKKTDALAKLDKAGLDEKFSQLYKMIIEQEIMMFNMMFNQKKVVNEMKGKPSPTFNYENHKGGTTKLEDLRGKYVYIDVWATWCGPCRAEIPHLKKVEEKYHDKKITFVSISVDVAKDHEKWQKFVTNKELGGVQLFADKDWNSEFIKAFGINSIPRFLLIDPTGKIVNADAPRPSSEELHELLDSLL